MKIQVVIVSFLLCFATCVCGAVHDTFLYRGVQYEIIKEDADNLFFEVSAVRYDSSYIILPDSVTHGSTDYAVTGAIVWYNHTNCSLRHYDKIDLSGAQHLISLSAQISALIAVDTLILPPNLMRFPMYFYTSDSLNRRVVLMDEDNLLPGIHRVYSTGTQGDNFVRFMQCTSLIEADVSSYTSTHTTESNFAANPFLAKLAIPNTIKVFGDGIFNLDIRLTDVNIPDSLEEIIGVMTAELAMDTLQLGEKVSEISRVFANGWYNLKHIEVDPYNPYYKAVNGVLYTQSQLLLHRYPFTRDGSVFEIPSKTEYLGFYSFAHSHAEADYMDPAHYTQLLKSQADSAPLKNVVCHPALKSLEVEGVFFGSSVRTLSGFEETQVKSIPNLCFAHSAIDSISLPLGLTEIEPYAFYYTYNLQEVMNMPRLRYLETIGESAFRHAARLRALDMLTCNKVLELPSSLCQDDSIMQYVSLPRNVEVIRDSVFAGCVSLQQIVCPAVVPIPVDPSVFEGVDKQNCVLKVPARSLSLYKNAPVWQEFFHIDTDGFYYIETSVSDTTAGSVTGDGAYLSGEYATLTATASKGYRFVSWSDGYTYSTRTFQVTQNETFTAIFEEIPPTFYTLTVQANNDNWGEVSGSGQYEAGTVVTLTATPHEGYFLRYWSFTDLADESILYTMPPVSVTLTAYFMPRDESIEGVEQPAHAASKILRDGHVLILRNGKYYSVTGQETNRK